MIEFQYFEGCPNAKASLNNLLEIKDELNIGDDEIRVIQVPDMESAEKNRFQGSPTILIRGVDIYTDSITPVVFILLTASRLEFCRNNI